MVRTALRSMPLLRHLRRLLAATCRATSGLAPHFGSSLRSFLPSPRAVRAFNLVMAALLLASLYPVFMDA